MATAAGVPDTGGDQLPQPTEATAEASSFLAVHDHIGDWTVVRLASTLDALATSSLRELFADLAERGEVNVLVDLTAVPFIDSAGLGVVIGACRRFRALDGDLRLAGARPNVSSVLRVTGISRVITVYPTPEEALADVTAD